MVVGEAPGETETLTKVPFTGSAGKMLWSLLNNAGINKQHLILTNCVSCRPPDNRTPTTKECDNCFERLKSEIHQTRPKLIVALGEVALNHLTGKSGIQKKRGEIFPLTEKWEYQCDVLAVLHPSFIMRQRMWIDTTVKDLKMINASQEGVVVKKSFEKPPFIYNPNPEELTKIFERMSKKTCAVDIETPGQLDVLTASVIGIAFYAGDEAVALDFSQAYPQDVWEVMKNYLEDPNAKKCTQNGQFDWAVLESNGIKCQGLDYDTLLAEHTMNADLPGNLDFLRNRYTDLKSYKPDSKAMKKIGVWSAEQRMEYNCWDVIATLEVMKGQMKVMGKEQLNVLKEFELPLINVCNYMERKGILVDVNTLALTNSAIQPKLAEMDSTTFNPLHLNPRSPVQLKKFFNLESTGKDQLKEAIRKGHPQKELMQKILDYRELDKISSVYLVGIYKKLKSGRIHAHPKIGGTATGRLSYQEPNLQNVPKNLRNIFIPDTPEHVFIESDYSQLELRVIANLAPEPKMLEMFARNERVHSLIGMERYGKKWDDLTPREKLLSKAIVFGTIYGSSARSIAIREGITVKEAEHLQTICLKNFPGLVSYLERCSQNFNSTRISRTPFGRIRYLQTIPQAFNTPIQSSASDVTTGSLVGLYKLGLDLRITVHDSIVIQCLKKDKKEVLSEVKKVMERPIPQLNNYSFPVKSEIGINWRDVKEEKED
jgi:DNA polymerase-1